MSKNNNNIIGHTIRLFKKSSDFSFPVKGDAFSFVAFGNFDGVITHNINKITQFADDRIYTDYLQKECGSHYCAHYERQILNLLRLNKNLLKPAIVLDSEKCEKPIIAITTLTSYDNDRVIFSSKLEEALERIKNGNEIEYEVFNVLSSEDKVVILRSNNVSTIFDMIKEFCCIQNNDNVNIYTAMGVFTKHIERWKEVEGKDVYAKIRLHVRPTDRVDEFIKSLKENPELLKAYEELPDTNPHKNNPRVDKTLGKYDVAIDYPLTTPKGFIELFSEGVFALCRTNVEDKLDVLISSNTVFTLVDDDGKATTEMSLTLPVINGEVNVQNNKEGDNYPWEKLFKRTKNIKNESVRRAAIVLAERVHLIKHSVFSHKNFELIYGFVISYFSHLEDSDDSADSRKICLDQIARINLFIDNIFSYSYRDFESLQKDIRIVVDAGKLLLAYSNFVVNIFKDNSKDYKALVIPNIDKVIDCAWDPQTSSFIAKVHEETIFDINTNLMLLSHEAGHAFDNKSLFRAYKAFTIHFMIHNEVYRFYDNSKFNKNCGDPDKTTFIKGVRDYLNKHLEESFFDFNEKDWSKNDATFTKECVKRVNIYIGEENESRKKRKHSVEIEDKFELRWGELGEKIPSELLASAYKEAFADMFMVKQLNLNFEEYFLMFYETHINNGEKYDYSQLIRTLAVYFYMMHSHTGIYSYDRLVDMFFETVIEKLEAKPDSEFKKEVKEFSKSSKRDKHFNVVVKECAEVIHKTVKKCDDFAAINPTPKADSFRIISNYHKDIDEVNIDDYVKALEDILGIKEIVE